jgi:sirohydrochlorin cobaltochelatase
MSSKGADVVLVGHGSQRTRAFEIGLLETARRLQARYAGRARVRPGFFEFLEPTVEQSILALAAEGSRRIVVMPYFLFDGKEIKFDIPRELDHIRERAPGVEIVQASSLGVAGAVIEIIAERVAGALDGLCQYPYVAGRLPRRGATGPLGVILVNRGSRRQYDDGARLRELTARAEARLAAPVRPAQAENSEQTIERAADELAALGARRIVVVPYLHHPGKVLFADVIPAIARAGQAHPDCRFALAWTLCVDDRLVDLCVQRIAEADGPSAVSHQPSAVSAG